MCESAGIDAASITLAVVRFAEDHELRMAELDQMMNGARG